MNSIQQDKTKTSEPPRRQRRQRRSLKDTARPDPEEILVDKEHAVREHEAAAKIVSYEDLLHHFNIERWDYLLVGDGSGSRWPRAIGWTSVLIDHATRSRLVFHGGANCGTNVLAEMMAYVHPLLYLSQGKPPAKVQLLHIVTDCEYLTFAAQHRESRKAHKELWSFFDVFTRRGLMLRWHYVPRDTIDLNRFADSLAGISRRAIMTVATDETLAEVCGKFGTDDIHGLNPRLSS